MVATRTALLRVVSYNVLSSHLATPSQFSSLNPEHLDAANRLPKLLDKLQHELDLDKSNSNSNSNSNDQPQQPQKRSTIFCLQEVSYNWCSALHVFFANRGYHVVSGLYGPSYNGYMGVVTAYPTETLETVDVDISRLSDTYEHEWPEPPPKPSVLSKIWSKANAWWLLTMASPPQKEPEDPWKLAQRRSNVLLTTVLKDKRSGCQFGIANYHMPCAYYNLPAMTLHADLCVAHVQRVVARHSDPTTTNPSPPYVLAGDFNFKPNDPAYQLVTTGQLDRDSPGFPPPVPSQQQQPQLVQHQQWQPTLREPLQSAYMLANGCEPDFTNNALTQGMDEPFVETLDYIFVAPNSNNNNNSNSIQVESVLTLPHRQDDGVNGPFPNANEPSDHILIAANLCVSSSSNNDNTDSGINV